MDNKIKRLRYYTEFKIAKDSIQRLNPEFSLCTVLVAYHGDNRNRSSISKEVFNENLWSIYGIPIIGEWIRLEEDQNKETWGSHGGRIILDDSGVKYEQTTRPFGFVSEDAYKNASWVTILEKDGNTEHEYLKLENCILWNSRYEECNSILEENFGQSMEISEIDGDYRDDGYFNIQKFIFSSLCILGSKNEPCFESAMIGRQYELNQFKQEVQAMMDKYKEFNLEVNASKLKINETTPKEDGGKMKLTPQIVDKVKSQLLTDKFRSDKSGSYYWKYEPITVTETEIHFVDREASFKVYSAPYIITETNNDVAISIDLEKKVEKSFIVGDKVDNEFNIQKEVDTLSSDMVSFAVANHESLITKDLQTRLNEKIAEIKFLTGENQKQKDQIAVFVREKSDLQKKNHEDATNAIVNTYATLINKFGDFDEYRARLDYSKTLEEIERDCKLMYANYNLDKDKKSAKFSFTGVESGIVGNQNLNDDPMRARYGDAFDNF